MSAGAALGNIVAASIQAAIVVAIASAVLGITRLRAPGVTYAFWRAVGGLCLILPWAQPHDRLSGTSQTAFVLDAAVDGAARATTAAATAASTDIAVIVLVIIGGGAFLRLSWLVVGVARLRRLRRQDTEAPADLGHDLQRTLGTRAGLRYLPSLQHPVTFGVTTPVVLLPDSLRLQSPDVQRAVIGHELIHVQRRDWLWLLVEEIGLSLLWFHPAAWWVSSRIQLAREEVVDELAVLLTGRRRLYVEALLAFSDSTTVVPTAAFARRRHLLRRIALISREDSMSSRRIVVSCAVMALAIIGGAWRAVAAFPLHADAARVTQPPAGPGPLERRAHAVTPENPVPRRVHYEPPIVPDIAESASANVVLKITVDEVGMVAEARPVSIRVKAPEIQFSVVDDNNAATRMTGFLAGFRDGKGSDVAHAIVDSAMTSVKAWRYDPPAQAPLTFSVTIVYGEPETAPRIQDEKVLKVGGGIKPPTKIVDVRPVYPPEARAAGTTGVVILETRIAADGSVEEARVLKSVSKEIDQAAIDAVRGWKFTPTLMNGEPTAVIMTVTVNFTLQ